MKKTANKNLIYGRHPVMEALQGGKSLDKLIIQLGIGGEFMSELKALAGTKGIPVQKVPVEKLNKLSRNNNHQGVAAFTSLIPYYTLEDLLSQAYARGEMPLFLICDGITDVRNLGAIARSAACSGVHGIILPAKGSAAINGEAIKTSAGALHQVHVCKVRFLDEAIRYLQNNGLQVVASSLHTRELINEVDLSIPTAIVVGAEDKGVSPKFLKMADKTAKIPMIGDFDSFNVSVATGILLYEAMRQRRS